MSEICISVDIRATNKNDEEKIKDALIKWLSNQDKSNWKSHGFICIYPNITFFIKTQDPLPEAQINEIYAILNSFYLEPDN